MSFLRVLRPRWISQLENDAQTQAKFHLSMTYFWLASMGMVPFIRTFHGSVASLLIMEVSLYANAATEFGALTSAQASREASKASQNANATWYNPAMSYPQGYAQTDPRWADDLLGYDSSRPWDLGNYGCLVTAVGNMAWWITDDSGYTPRVVNNWMQDNQGFQPGGGVMYWQAVPRMLRVVTPAGEATTLADTTTFLAADPANYAIIEVRAPGQHFVFAPTATQMVDSEDGRFKPIGHYAFYHAHLYRDNRGEGSAIAPHVLPTTNGDIIMPSAQDVHDYITAYTGVDATETQVAFYTTRQWQTLATDVAQFLVKQAAAQVATSVSQATTLQNQVATLTDENKRLVAATQVPTNPTVVTDVLPVKPVTGTPDWQSTYRPDARTRTAARDGEAVDYAGQLPSQAITTGMVFQQAGTFVAGGVVQVRTRRSVTEGNWYGTPESLFDDVPSDRGGLSLWQRFNLWTSQLFGQAKHFETTMLAKAFNKEPIL